MSQRVLTFSWGKLRPIFKAPHKDGLSFYKGQDDFGAYIAYRLNNQKRSPFFCWYILISPEDEALLNHGWSAHVTKSGIDVRWRPVVDKTQQNFSLSRTIWQRMYGKLPKGKHVYHQGHQLDFRRRQLSLSKHSTRCRGVSKRAHSGWQVQIGVHGITYYVCMAPTLEEGYRLYNRHLRTLRETHPDDLKIQSMPYNEVDPLF